MVEGYACIDEGDDMMEHLKKIVYKFTYNIVFRIIKLVIKQIGTERRLRKILKLKEVESILIIPLREGELENYGARYKFATSQEVKASLNIMKLLNCAGYPFCARYEEVVFGNKSYSSMALMDERSYNIFSIGGPYGNSFACFILRRYFKNFIMSCGVDMYEKCNKFEKAEFYCPHNDDQYYVKYLDNNGEEQFIYYNQGYQSNYIVMIKMTEADFNYSVHGTVHLLWGGRADVTEAASKVFLQHEKEIYKKLKKRKKHYFIVCEYYKEFGLDFDKWYDLTDIMFKKIDKKEGTIC